MQKRKRGNMEIKLRQVRSDDYEFLTLLYFTREPEHKKHIITLEQNRKFVKNYCKNKKTHYYAGWYIVLVDGKKAGAYTIDQENETGSWLLPEYRGKGIGTKAYGILFKKEPRKEYNAKVEEHDDRAYALALRVGFKFSSYDYEHIWLKKIVNT